MDGDEQNHGECLELDAYRIRKSETMIHAELRALHSYWEALRAGRATPLRAEIDPREMTCDLRHLFILEHLGHGNIRFRVAGTALIDAFGMELRGLSARAIMAAASRESFSALIGEVIEDPGVGYARLRDVTHDGVVWEISLLPLRSDFGEIDRVLGCLHPLSGPGVGETGQPLRFRIENMSVDTITRTVHEAEEAVAVREFAEAPSSFHHQDPVAHDGFPSRLHSIDGGLVDGDEFDGRPARTRGHLRLVDD